MVYCHATRMNNPIYTAARTSGAPSQASHAVPEFGGVTDHNVVHEAEKGDRHEVRLPAIHLFAPACVLQLKDGHERPKADSKPDLSITL